MSVTPRMIRRFIVGTLPAACLATLLLSGCGGPTNSDPSDNKTSVKSDSHDHHGHAHEAEGPHHGHLIELGNDEYHGEIVHGEGEQVTVYVLDGSAKNLVPIDATEVVINLTHEGKAAQFKLAALPENTDPDGKSSRFQSTEKSLADALNAKGNSAKLVLTINGNQYSGKIDHDHDHHDHDHKH